MIVFDLICGPGGHQFEGWFSSSSDYEEQLACGLLSCPSCGSTAITKAVMAPNVTAKSNQATGSQGSSKSESADSEATKSVTNSVQVPAEYKDLAEKMAKAQQKILEKSEWVGEEFPEQARAIHYGETDEKLIHGTATSEQAEELSEEGIDVAPLPFPVAPPKAQN